jgi:hypothetical protein
MSSISGRYGLNWDKDDVEMEQLFEAFEVFTLPEKN